jgi:hypothetical protein
MAEWEADCASKRAKQSARRAGLTSMHLCSSRRPLGAGLTRLASCTRATAGAAVAPVYAVQLPAAQAAWQPAQLQALTPAPAQPPQQQVQLPAAQAAWQPAQLQALTPAPPQPQQVQVQLPAAQAAWQPAQLQVLTPPPPPPQQQQVQQQQDSVPWTSEADARLIALLASGTAGRWDVVAVQLGRSVFAVQQRFQELLARSAAQQQPG